MKWEMLMENAIYKFGTSADFKIILSVFLSFFIV